MRTTLDIDDDLLTAVKELAKARNTTAGRVISDLLRESLTRVGETQLVRRNGFWVLPKRGGVVTSELVKRLAEDDL
jgi:hypothetical protein